MDSDSDTDSSEDNDSIDPKDYTSEQDYWREVCDRSLAPNPTILSVKVLILINAWNAWNSRAKPIPFIHSLFHTHDEQFMQLRNAFKTSYQKKQFDTFIALYQSLTSDGSLPPIPTGTVGMLSTSFATEYRGPGAAALLAHLKQEEKNFSSNHPRPYYARFFCFIQASGTGKTRTIMQLSQKGVIVIYICLRDEVDVDNFPARDEWPAQIILTKFPADGTAYLVRCYLFLAALFSGLKDILEPEKHRGVKGMATWFEEEYGVHATTKRKRYFASVREIYERLKSTSHEPFPDTYVRECQAKMSELYQDFVEAVFGSGNSQGRPKLVIAVDEAQAMSEKQQCYTPSYYLCHALSELVKLEPMRSYPIWTIFCSTSLSLLSRFVAEPQTFHASQRVAIKGRLVGAPFTTTGYDQLATTTPEADLLRVGSLAQLRGFGRPLWGSFSEHRSDKILPLARQKLIHGGSLESDGRLVDQALAVLSQRFGLDVAFGHPQSVKFIDTAICSYMRYCNSITVDQAWRFTSYPSEPIMSSAAATVMHQGAQNLIWCLRVLNDKVRSGMIDRGARGELVCRLLLLLGRDYTPEVPSILSATSPTVPFCRPVKLLDYLGTTFGLVDLDQDVRDAFDVAYINFSHWVSLKGNIQPSKKTRSLFDQKEFLYRHWIRGSALQFSDDQPLANQAMVIYHDDPSTPARDRTSSFIVSNSLKATSSKPDLQHLHPRNEAIGLDTKLASVVVLCDTGLTPGPATWSYDEKDKCLRIHVPGVSRMSYPFLALIEDLEKLMVELMTDARQSETLEEDAVSLGRRALEIGTSSLACDLKWENLNIDVPDEDEESDAEMIEG